MSLEEFRCAGGSCVSIGEGAPVPRLIALGSGNAYSLNSVAVIYETSLCTRFSLPLEFIRVPWYGFTVCFIINVRVGLVS